MSLVRHGRWHRAKTKKHTASKLREQTKLSKREAHQEGGLEAPPRIKKRCRGLGYEAGKVGHLRRAHLTVLRRTRGQRARQRMTKSPHSMRREKNMGWINSSQAGSHGGGQSWGELHWLEVLVLSEKRARGRAAWRLQNGNFWYRHARQTGGAETAYMANSKHWGQTAFYHLLWGINCCTSESLHWSQIGWVVNTFSNVSTSNSYASNHTQNVKDHEQNRMVQTWEGDIRRQWLNETSCHLRWATDD